MGKTQLAAAYARAKLAGGWRLIAWVDAQNVENVLAGLVAVASATRLSEAGPWPGAAAAGQAVRHWLEADGHRCLVVFDGAEDPDVLRPFVPVGGAARVLITAAREPVAELGEHIAVDAFTVEEALALLSGRTGLGDEAGAAAVAAELGHLPLGLDHAAAVIAGQGLGYTAYLAQLRALPAEQYQARDEERPYPKGVGEAVLLSLVAARAADRVGVCTGVMEVVAVLSPAAVRWDLLRAAGQSGLLGSGGHRVSAALVDEALTQLEERSLVGFSLDRQAVTVHHLVARVVRDGLARRGRLAAACQAAASVLSASAESLPEARDSAAVGDLLGQVAALLDNGRGTAGGIDEELARTLMQLRLLALHHLIELGDSMPQAIVVGESLTADLDRLLGADHPDTLSTRNTLARAYRETGRVAEAIPLFEQTLAGRERVLGPDHPDTMRTRNNLAAAFREAGRIADAVPLVEQILATRERISGADHPSTLASRNNLAAAYLAAGRPTEAVTLFEQNLAACERLLGPDHSRTRTTRDNLTVARQKAGCHQAISLSQNQSRTGQ